MESDQNWPGINEYGNNYYYPVLPKLDKFNRNSEGTMGLQSGSDGFEKTPFGKPNRNWNENDKTSAVTNTNYVKSSLSMNIAAKEKDPDTSDDLSGNGLAGVLMGDYRVEYNERKEPVKQTIVKKSKFKTEDKPF